MTEIINAPLPKPKIHRRPIDSDTVARATASGCDPLLAQILAGRAIPEAVAPDDFLNPKLSQLDNPALLADMDKAVARLMLALERKEVIGIETDHDCDGQTSHAVIYSALTGCFGVPKALVRSYIGHRLKEGYGLSDALADRILADEPKPTLIITADNGSADELRIARLKLAGIDVIVTDHHEIPVTGIPESAYAVLSPLRANSAYPDRAIAGCMVAWLFMAATRQACSQKSPLPSIAGLLDFVAVGTIADCVSMAKSQNNRAVVNYGIRLIQQRLRPCWRALFEPQAPPISSEDLGFKIGPLLNSDGRLACAFGSVSFLLSETDQEAAAWVTHLREQNTLRKQIQDKITQRAIQMGAQQTAQGKKSLCLFLEEGHAGVHGISASRIKDLFGRPTVILCPRPEDPNLLTGSARSIPEIHLRELLQAIHDSVPGCLERFGGHQGAAGLTLNRNRLSDFERAFEAETDKIVSAHQLGPVIWTDGILPESQWEMDYIEQLTHKLEPFGREFEPPQFEAVGTIVTLAPVGKTQTHARLGIRIEDVWLDGIWFNAKKENDPWPVRPDDRIKFVYTPKVQIFRGQRQLKAQIVYLEPA